MRGIARGLLRALYLTLCQCRQSIIQSLTIVGGPARAFWRIDLPARAARERRAAPVDITSDWGYLEPYDASLRAKQTQLRLTTGDLHGVYEGGSARRVDAGILQLRV